MRGGGEGAGGGFKCLKVRLERVTKKQEKMEGRL